jgi:hypothetical protein
MVTLRWHCDKRECSASLNTIEGARAYAAILRTRAPISGVMLFDENYANLPLEP